MLFSLELCAGGGGQALGLEWAGFQHQLLIDNDNPSVATLKLNRPKWNAVVGDLKEFSGSNYKNIDLVAGGVPCPPFSIAGKQLGPSDERDLFQEAVRIIGEVKPRAVMIENVRGLMNPKFDTYRTRISILLKKMGFITSWRILNACHFGVPQLRPRLILVGLHSSISEKFSWPMQSLVSPPTVGECLYDLMGIKGWCYVDRWRSKANKIAPTIVGGSKKHGGPDLGPTRARKAWAALGVNGNRIEYEPPDRDFKGEPGFEFMPYLTVPMVARLQGFPDEWQFSGKKTTAYRQVGNAFPPPVAAAVAGEIASCLRSRRSFPVK